MPERADQPALAVHRQIAGCPDARQADVTGEYCILGCQVAHRLRDLLGMNKLPARGGTESEIIETLAGFTIVFSRPLQVSFVPLLIQDREQSL